MERLGFAINTAIYAAYFSGVLLAFSGTADIILKRIKLRRRLSSGKTALKALTEGWARLLPLCGLILFASFLIAVRSFYLVPALLASMLSASIPLLIRLVKKGRERRLAGREGISLVTELSRQYLVKEKNIYEAMEAAISLGKGFPVSAKHLSQLLMRLRDAGSASAVSAACRRFASSSGSLWGRMLSECIKTAVLTGADVSEAVSDIAEQLSSAQKLSEERKRLNSEAVRMTVFLVPLLYAGTMLVAAGFLKMELSDILRNQFASPEGLILLLLSVFLFLLDVVLLQAIEGRGVDI